MVFDNSSNNFYNLSNIFDNLSILIDMVTVCGFVFPRKEQLAHGGLSPSFPLGIAISPEAVSRGPYKHYSAVAM